MTTVIRIDDSSDPRLDPVRAIRETERQLRSAGRIVAESPLTVARAIGAGHTVELVVATPSVLARLPAVPPSTRVIEVVQRVLDEAVGFPIHRGAIAIVVAPKAADLAGIVAASRRLAVVEGVNDLENLGVIFRSAAALGIDAVVLGPGSGDPWSRRCVRVSVGTSLDVPWVLATVWPAELDLLREVGFHLAALTPRGGETLAGVWRHHDRVAVVLGAEGSGVSSTALELADSLVGIPMARDVDSLNVASAAAIAFHAVRR